MNNTDTKSPEARSFLPAEIQVPVAPQPSIAAPVPTKRREGARINLTGEIDPKGPLSLLAIKQMVLRHPEEMPKTIYINSSGGNILEAFKAYEWLHSLPIPMATVADKHCLSAGLILFLAGDFRIANPGTELLLHGTHMGTDDFPPRLNAQKLQRYSDDLKSDDCRILDLLEARTGFDRSAFEVEMSDERAMSECFAIDSGIVHELPGLNRVDPTWVEAARQMQAAGMTLPPRLASPNYFAACREAAHFPVIV